MSANREKKRIVVSDQTYDQLNLLRSRKMKGRKLESFDTAIFKLLCTYEKPECIPPEDVDKVRGRITELIYRKNDLLEKYLPDDVRYEFYKILCEQLYYQDMLR